MRFAEPSYLVVAALAATVLILLFLALGRARRRALAQVGSLRLLPGLTASLSRRRRLFKQASIVTGAVLMCVALARPQLGFRWEQAHRRGVDILFAIDTSKSMLTRDVKPNRLERAKLAVRSLIRKFPRDRVGLVAFAGSAFVETPLTLDHAIFDESVAGLDTHVIPLGGTNIESAIEKADGALASNGHRKVVVLITDGENLDGSAMKAAQQAAKDKVVVYTLGVGTPKGELIPERGPDGQTRFVRDENGVLVTSRLDEGLLARIARATGGDYRPLGDSGQGLEALYADKLSKLPRSDLASRSTRVPVERYQWPLGLALLLLAIEPLVSERRRIRNHLRHAKTAARPVAAAVGLGGLLVSSLALASPQSAQRAYQKGDFASAERQYAEAAKATPSDPRLNFNLGAAAYRKGDFNRAGKAFESALRSDNLKLQEQAYYDLGNASYRLGETTLAKKDIEATKRQWKQAISEYQGALRLRPDDADARFNLEFVKKRLADLERQQKQQKQQNGGKGAQDQKQNGGKGAQDQKQNGGKGAQDQKQNGGKGAQDQKQNGGKGAQDQKNNDGKGAQDQKNQTGGQQGTPPPQGQHSAKQGEAPATPGDLSEADAEALLDSLRGELRVATPASGPKLPAAQQQQPRKDW